MNNSIFHLPLFYLNNITENYTKLISENISKVFNVGFVTLKPDEEIGTHSTKDYEELIITIEGSPILLIDNSKEIQLHTNTLILIPKFTKHNIINKSNNIAKYLYIIAK